jgi:hypothetical protein
MQHLQPKLLKHTVHPAAASPSSCKPQQLQAHTWPAVATCRTRGSLEGGPGAVTAATTHSCAPNQLAAHAAQPAHTQEKAQTLCRAGTPKPSAHYRRAHQVSQASCLFASPTSTTHTPQCQQPLKMHQAQQTQAKLLLAVSAAAAMQTMLQQAQRCRGHVVEACRSLAQGTGHQLLPSLALHLPSCCCCGCWGDLLLGRGG